VSGNDVLYTLYRGDFESAFQSPSRDPQTLGANTPKVGSPDWPILKSCQTVRGTPRKVPSEPPPDTLRVGQVSKFDVPDEKLPNFFQLPQPKKKKCFF